MMAAEAAAAEAAEEAARHHEASMMRSTTGGQEESGVGVAGEEDPEPQPMGEAELRVGTAGMDGWPEALCVCL